MARTYTLRRRADRQAETRQRIVDAAVALHAQHGPALTTLSMVAEQAGVQRHTLYAHFPDERSLFLACSGQHLERDPLPEAEPWRTVEDRRERLQAGLAALYDWYGRNAMLAGSALRDAEFDPLTREIVALRFGPSMAAYRAVLGARLGHRQRAMLHLALGFHCWRALVPEGGLDRKDAVAAMVQAILGGRAG